MKFVKGNTLEVTEFKSSHYIKDDRFCIALGLNGQLIKKYSTGCHSLDNAV